MGGALGITPHTATPAKAIWAAGAVWEVVGGVEIGAQPRLHQQIEHKGGKYLRRQVLLPGEHGAWIPSHAVQTNQVGPLRLLLVSLPHVLLIPWSPCFRCGDEQGLAVVQCQPGLPLRVAQGWAIGLEKLRKWKATVS